MSKYLTINDAVRAHIDDSAVYYSDATQSLNQLADSMGNEDAHASTIADALDRVLSSSSSGGASDGLTKNVLTTIVFTVDSETHEYGNSSATVTQSDLNKLKTFINDNTPDSVYEEGKTIFVEARENNTDYLLFGYLTTSYSINSVDGEISINMDLIRNPDSASLTIIDNESYGTASLSFLGMSIPHAGNDVTVTVYSID